jgi:hypothetical protein
VFSFSPFRPISSFLACAFPFRHHVARMPPAWLSRTCTMRELPAVGGEVPPAA